MDHAFMADLEARIMSATNIPTTMIVCDSVGTAKSEWDRLKDAVQRGTVKFEKFVQQIQVREFRKYVQKGEGLKYAHITRKKRRKLIRIHRKHGKATTFLYAGRGFNKTVVFPTIRYPDPPTHQDFELEGRGFSHNDLLDAVHGAMVMYRP